MNIPHALIAELPLLIRLVRRDLEKMHRGFDRNMREDALSVALEAFAMRAKGHVMASMQASRQWICQAATFALLAERRRRARFAGPEASCRIIEAEQSGCSASDPAEQVSLRARVVRLLGEAHAETVWLHEVEGHTPGEVAGIQNITVTTAKIRITRSRAKLRRLLPRFL